MEHMLTPDGIVYLPLDEIVKKLAHSLNMEVYDAIDTLLFAEELVEVCPDQWFVPYHLRSDKELELFFEGEVDTPISCRL